MSQLADFIEKEREDITQRWVEQLLATSVPTSLRREDVVDSMRYFLDELAVGLRLEDGLQQHARTDAPSTIAKTHGKQRFGLGYDIATMIREYGTLRDILYQAIEDKGSHISIRESRVISKYITNAIADAASQYALERDEELGRQSSRHISFLAHELRNPLASARLAISLLEHKGLLADNSSLGVINRGLQRMSDLIDSALLEMRLRAVPEPQRELIELEDFFRELVAECATDLQHKGLALKVEAPPGLSINADRKLLYSALSNLVRNAVKFSREGGTLHLRAKPDGDKRIAIDVEDECGGLPKDKVKSLFDPFVQVGKDRSGFGLGLAIAKQAASAHDGEIRVHNLPGKGCVFVLDLPTNPSKPNQE